MAHIRGINLGKLMARRHPRGEFKAMAFIAGTVKIEGVAARRRVRCFERQTGRFIAETWSAKDGTYRIDDLYQGRQYLIVAMDYDLEYNAVVADNVVPVPGAPMVETKTAETLIAPVEFATTYIFDSGGLHLTWRNVSHSQEAVIVYRSDAPMDPDNLPAPMATLDAFADEYTDATAIDFETYYYRLAVSRDGTVEVGTEHEQKAEPYYHQFIDMLEPTLSYDFLHHQSGNNRGTLGDASAYNISSPALEAAEGHTWLKGPHQTIGHTTGQAIFGSGVNYSATLLVRKGTSAYAGLFGGRVNYPDISVFFNSDWAGSGTSQGRINVEHFLESGAGAGVGTPTSEVGNYKLLTMVRNGPDITLYDGSEVLDTHTLASPDDTSPVLDLYHRIQFLRDSSYTDDTGRIGFAACFDKALTAQEVAQLTQLASEYTGMSL